MRKNGFIMHSVAYFPSACNNQCWTRPKPRARIFIQICQVVDRNPHLGLPLLPPSCVSRELAGKPAAL